MSADALTINVPIAEQAKEIFSELSGIQPDKSLSFVLTEEGIEAVQEAEKLADWGIGGNKPKLKEAAMTCLEIIGAGEAGVPININFTEYELKALGEVVDVIERALERHDDGVLKK